MDIISKAKYYISGRINQSLNAKKHFKKYSWEFESKLFLVPSTPNIGVTHK
jgi:hypothetical protein